MGGVIAITAQKGGVGKTTTALNLGYCLSKLGGRVLIVDCDPQGGLAVASNLKKRTLLGLVDVIKGSAALEGLSAEYDYAIIDTPAGTEGVSASILSASQSAILVVTCRALTLKTLPGFMKLLQWVRDNRNPALSLEGVLINMRTRGGGYEDEICSDLRESLPAEVFFDTEIPWDEAIEAASLRSVPVAMLRDGGEAAKGFTELALELKEREYRRRISEGAEEGDGVDQGLF